MRAPAYALFGLLFTTILAAQSTLPDPNAKRIAWGTANVVLRSDTASGLYVYAATSKVVKHSVPTRSFAARFDPDSVIAWAGYARKLLQAPKPPSAPNARLQTPRLWAIDQSSIIFDRAAEGNKWSSTVRLVFSAPDSQASWSIATRAGEAAVFLATLERSSSASFYLPANDTLFTPNPADTTICPRPLTIPVIQYPRTRQAAGQQGDVWLTFVVRADSTVDPASIRVLISDGADFTQSAAQAVTSVRYQPATGPHGPIDAHVFQRVTFLLE